MNIIELIEHLKNMEQAEALINIELPGVEFNLVEIYMKDSLSLESEIVFFDSEKIPDRLIIEIDGIRFENLFPLYMLQEMIEDSLHLPGPSISNEDLAKRILDYREKDA